MTKKIYKYYIILTKDFSSAEKYLPKFGFILYRKVINGIIWDGIIKQLGSKICKDYTPTYEKDKATFTQVSEDKKELEEEKKNLESWLAGSYKDIKDDERLKRAFNSRWVSKVYNHTKKAIMDHLVRDSVLTFLNSSSILIEWGIK